MSFIFHKRGRIGEVRAALALCRTNTHQRDVNANAPPLVMEGNAGYLQLAEDNLIAQMGNDAPDRMFDVLVSGGVSVGGQRKLAIDISSWPHIEHEDGPG